MENLLWVLLVLILEMYASGAVFFHAFEYIEGRRLRRRWILRIAAIPASGLITLLTCGMMRGLSGYSAHPAAEAVAGLFVAAMLAATCSAVRLFCPVRKKRRLPARKKENPPRILTQERVKKAC